MGTSLETEKAADTAEEKDSHSWTGWIVWPVGILVLYVLSVGPAVMMEEKGMISKDNGFLLKLYSPLGWAYENTPLHKPLGMYLHLWSSKYFDKNGEQK